MSDFIEREARVVARELDNGNPQNTANLLREDCRDMTPSQFTKLVVQASRMENNGGLADLQIQRDGDVVVHGRDGRRYNAGRIPAEDACRINPPPPVVIIERPRYEPPHCQPDVIIIDRDRDRHDSHPPRGVYDRPVQRQNNSGLEMVIGGGLLGAGVAKRGKEVQGVSRQAI